MGTITFTGEKITKIKAMIGRAHTPAELMLVGDQGVYLMSMGTDKDGNKLHTPGDQVYADGISPNDEDWFDVKGDTFGYDDGADALPVSMFRSLFENPDHNMLVFAITPQTIDIFSKKA